MHPSTVSQISRALLVGAAVALPLAACGDSPAEPRPTPLAEVGVVVNSGDRSLAVFAVDDPDAVVTIGVAADGSPVTIAARDARAVIPLGTVPAAAVVDLIEREVVHTVPLPEGSGATGVAFVDDSIALVANPALNTVVPVNALRGTAGDPIAVGGYPHQIVAVGDTAYVLNAELGPDFQPTGPGTVSVITGSPLRVVETITLTGTNPGGGAAGADGRLYVVNSGRYGQGEGSVSVIDRRTLAEVDHVTGFGDFPSGAAIDDAGRLFVTSFGYGIAVWETGSGQFLHAPDDAVQPAGIPSASGVAIDSEGRVYTAEPACSEPGRVFRLNANFAIDAEIDAGTCPLGIVFTTIPESDA